MNKIIIVLLTLFQTALHAENLPAADKPLQSGDDANIIMPEHSSQYNLDGKKSRDGQYKSSYSTKPIDKRNHTPSSFSEPYGAGGSIYPVVPVIVISDE